MNVSSRLAAGSGLVLAMLLGVLAYQVIQVRRLAGVSRDLARSGLAAAELSLEQAHDLDLLETSARKAFLTGDPDYAKQAARLAGAIDRRQRDLPSLLIQPAARAEAERMSELLQPVVQEAGGLLPSVSEAGYLRRLEAAREQGRVVVSAARRAIDEDAARAQDDASRAQNVSLLAACLALAGSVAVLAMTARSINGPLGRLAGATRAVAQGRFDHALDASGGDEFARVAEDFNVMVRRLGELDQMKKDILSNVSHELKAPLAGMQETVRVLLEEIPGPLTPGQRHLLDLNLQSARRLSAMLAKMLDLARLEAGTMNYDLRERDVVPIVRDALAELEVRASERDVSFRPAWPGGSLWVRCDGDRLLQVVENLVENALKFSPRGAEVDVAVSSTEAAGPEGSSRAPSAVRAGEGGAKPVLITVADRGPGVPAQDKERIFERFHQAGGGLRRSEGGVGLGLAICKEIVAAHGGEIWVEDRPGGGSVFSMVLPESAVPGGGEAVAKEDAG